MICPKCGANRMFTVSKDTKLKETWKECFACGYKEKIIIVNKDMKK